jgi:hypothetical protein
MTINWTHDMDSKVRVGWLSGLSARQIAAHVGTPGVTDSVVRTRRIALGLPPRGPAEQVIGARYHDNRSKRAPDSKKPLPAPKLGPASQPRPWTERGRAECAFPVDSPNGVLSCCGPIPEGARRPYCDFHLTLTGTGHVAAA